jgi:hypothetical protein
LETLLGHWTVNQSTPAVFCAETQLRQLEGRPKSPEIIGKEMAATPTQGGKKANPNRKIGSDWGIRK